MSVLLWWLYYALVLVLGLTVGGLVAWRVRRRHPRATLESIHEHLPVGGLGVGIVGMLAAVFVPQIVDPIGEGLPLWVQGRLVAVSWTVVLAAMGWLSGFAGVFGQLTGHPKRGRFLAAALLLDVALLVTHWGRNAPVAHSLGDRVAPDGVVLQTESATCAAATLANLARSAGLSLGEREAAELLSTTINGTSPAQMRYALDRLGFNFSTVRQSSPDLDRVSPPAILFVDHPSVGREGHAVAFFGRTSDGRFEIWDPLIGKRFYAEEHLLTVWHGGGIECWREGR